MSYFSELKCHWRSLASASLGLSVGYSIIQYSGNLFTPVLIETFNWERSQLALVGMVAVLAVICQPLTGRLCDRFGVRRVAMVGVIAAPVLMLGLVAMTGSIWQYFVLSFLLVVLVGGTTSATIYSRLIAQRFEAARGIALALAASAPAALAAVSTPFLAWLIQAQGWKAGYIALAIGMGAIGSLALLLVPKEQAERTSEEASISGAGVSYRKIAKNPALVVILASMFLCSIAFTLQTTQLKVLLLDHGVSSSLGSIAISVFAVGVVAGRLICGVALDRFKPYVVACIAMVLPAVGLFILAADQPAAWLIILSALLLGSGVGAEGDVMAYLVMRYFCVEVYSSVLGIVLGTIALSITVGSLLLSYTLKISDGSYDLFIYISGTSIVIGSLILLRLRQIPFSN